MMSSAAVKQFVLQREEGTRRAPVAPDLEIATALQEVTVMQGDLLKFGSSREINPKVRQDRDRPRQRYDTMGGWGSPPNRPSYRIVAVVGRSPCWRSLVLIQFFAQMEGTTCL